MEFIEGSRGTYRPIRVLSDRALQICWHVGSYEAQIPLVAGVSRLQQKNQLPSGVTAGDMTELLVEESKSTLRVQLWEFELEAFDEADARPLLKLVFEMNTGMKMRDVEFEARRLLKSPEAISPQFQHPKIISQAHEYARSPTEQQRESPSSKLLGPREVVMEVVPKVLQGFWLPLPNTSFNMPSKQLSKMAAGVTKEAVEVRVSTVLRATLGRVAFSRSVRDDMVLSIQEKVRRGYAQDGLVKRLDCFAPEMPDAITDVAAGEICVLLQHRTRTKVSVNVNADKDCIQPADVVDGAEAQNSAEDVNEEPGPEEDTEAIRGPGSAVVTPPCGDVPVRNGSNHSRTEQPAPSPEPDSAGVSSPPLPLSLRDEPTVVTAVQGVLTSSADPAAAAAIHDGLNNSLDEAEEQPALGPQPDSAVVSSPPPPVIPVDEPPVSSAAPDEAIITEQPVKLDESLNATTEVKMAEMRGVGCFFGWLQKYVYCCVLPEDDTEAA